MTTKVLDDKLVESLDLVCELSTRIDERVKNLVQKQHELDSKMEKMAENQTSFLNRISAIEVKLNNGISGDVLKIKDKLIELEIKQESLNVFKQSTESKFASVVEVIFKIFIGVATTFLIWKFGFK